MQRTSKKILRAAFALFLALAPPLIPQQAKAVDQSDCVWGAYLQEYRLCLYYPSGGCVACIVIVQG
jgi:hypothetical protein